MSFHDAFTPLLTRSRQLAYRLLGDHEEAREVAAEAMARLFEHWDALGHDLDHCTAWTLRVTRNLAIDTLRRRARERQLPGHDLEAVDTGSELELRLAVLDAVRELPEQQRRVIALRYLLDLSQADVAAALGVHPGTVATHVSRALSRLRRALDLPAPATVVCPPRMERTTMQITSIDQAAALIGTDRPVAARFTGWTREGGFTADIGLPAVYRGRGQRRARWLPGDPAALVGTGFDCVVLDIDDEQRPVVTDALTGPDAADFDRRLQQVRDLRAGQRFPGTVASVVPFGAFVIFDGLRGLIHVSDLDQAAPLSPGQNIEVEVTDIDARLARINLRISRAVSSDSFSRVDVARPIERWTLTRSESLTVEAVVSLCAGERLPAIFFVHGHLSDGFSALGYLGWRWAEQALVCCPSMPGYGGSTGPADFCGPSTRAAVRDVLDAFLADPRVDPTRVALWGVSRGACVAAQLLAEVGDRFRCAVLQSGIYDLAAEAARPDMLPRMRANMMAETGGGSAEALEVRSPIRQAASMTGPILLIHGGADVNASPDVARQFDLRLQEAGVDHETHIIDGAGHVLGPRRDQLVRPFLDRHLLERSCASAR